MNTYPKTIKYQTNHLLQRYPFYKPNNIVKDLRFISYMFFNVSKASKHYGYGYIRTFKQLLQ